MMKCQICGKKTSWDTSVGVEEFIVCNPCVEKVKSRLRTDAYTTLQFIFSCGYIRREIENENGDAL